MRNTRPRYGAMSSSILAGLIWVFAAAPSLANPDLNCAAYAAAAVAQANNAKSLGCIYEGGRWTTDYDRHFNWCESAGVDIMAVSTEDQLRKQGLQTCSATVAACDAYAQGAVQAQSENVRSNCGYTGGRWSANYNGHKTWCMTASAAAIKAEDETRGLGLSQCLIGDGSNLPSNDP